MANNQMENCQICHINCQSLFAHIDEFRSFFENSGYHIICLFETWLKPAMFDNMVSLQGYYLHRNEQTGKTGGGVAFYVNEHLRIRTLGQSDNAYCRKPEYILAEVSSEGSPKILLAVIYRPPALWIFSGDSQNHFWSLCIIVHYNFRRFQRRHALPVIWY